MTQSISAAIHIQGPTIRYAEIGPGSSAADLRRFGRETFEFDVMRAVWGEEGGAKALDRVGVAAQEALDGTEASTIGLVVHPLDVYSFFMPLPAGLSERERGQRVVHQAALLTKTRSPDALHTTAQSVRTVEAEGEALEWIHVLTVPRAVEERLETLVAALPAQDFGRMVSTEAVAQLMGHTGTERALPAENEGAYRLAIGQYPSHTEYALTRDGTWHHAHAAQEARSPENRAYYGVGLLNRIGVPLNEIERLFVYGPDADSAPSGPFGSIFNCSPVPAHPSEVFPRMSGLPGEEALGPDLLCIGGALSAQSA